MLLSWHLHPTICIFSKAEVEAGNPSEGSQTPCHHACLKVFQRSKAVFSSLTSPHNPHIPMHNRKFVLPLLIFSLFSEVLLRSLLSARQHTKSPFILASPQHRGSIWAVENSPWLILNLPRIIRCIWYHCQCCPIWQRELHCTWPTACHLLRACELGVSKGWGALVL